MRAQKIGGALYAQGLSGQPVLLLFPFGPGFIDAFLGCLVAGVIAVPCPTFRWRRQSAPLRSILSNSGATTILSEKALAGRLAEMIGDEKESGLSFLLIESLLEGRMPGETIPPEASSGVAFLQYTSGSTSEPRGVVVSQTNLIANEQMIQRAFGHSERTIVVGWLPHNHDMGLIGNLLQPLFIGGEAILMAPNTFLQNPVRWLQAISHYRATTAGAPNFAYDLCTRKIGPEFLQELDLGCWEVAYNGAEMISSITMDAFSHRFQSTGFRSKAFLPCYGLAEATLIVSAKSYTKTYSAIGVKNVMNGTAALRVSCGEVLCQDLRVVDSATGEECEPTEEGEIWIAGPSVAQRYWNNAADTARVFGARLAARPDQVYCRTGDLGFFLDGELYLTGRIKDLIIVRGVNHHPEELEQSVRSIDVRFSDYRLAAFGALRNGVECFCLAIEMRPVLAGETNLTSLGAQVAAQVAHHHEIRPDEILFVRPGSIPVTSSGKVKRSQCFHYFETNADVIIARWRPAESERLSSSLVLPETDESRRRRLVIEFLRHSGQPNFSEETVWETPLTALGLDSLQLAELVTCAQSSHSNVGACCDLNPEMTLGDLLASADAVSSVSLEDKTTERDPTQDEETLSIGQQALYFVHQAFPGEPVLNLAVAVRIEGSGDFDAFAAAWSDLQSHYPELNSALVEAKDGVSFSRRLEKARLTRLEFPREGGDNAAREILERFALQPYDLRLDPLIRAGWMDTPERKDSVVVIGAHHLITDLGGFRSLWIMLLRAYLSRLKMQEGAARPVSQRNIRFSNWQRSYINSTEGQASKAFWAVQHRQNWKPLRPWALVPQRQVTTSRVHLFRIEIPRHVASKLKDRAAIERSTAFNLYLTVFSYFLWRLTGEETIRIGSTISYRLDSRFREDVEYRASPIFVQTQPAACGSARGLWRTVREQMQAILRNFRVPALLQAPTPEAGSQGGTGLFNVAFVWLGEDHENQWSRSLLHATPTTFTFGKHRFSSVALDLPYGISEIELDLGENQGDVFGILKLNAQLYDRSTGQSLADAFLREVEAFANELEFSETAWANRSILSFSGIDRATPVSVTQRFNSAVDRAGSDIAVTCGEEILTYAELQIRSRALAARLKKEGCSPEEPIALLAENGIDWVVGLWGILLSGTHFVCFDPRDVGARWQRMALGLGARIWVAGKTTEEQFPESIAWLKENVSPLNLVVISSSLAAEKTMDRRQTDVRSDDLAYLVFTSGSTGIPKGILHRHGTLDQFVVWQAEQLNVGRSSRMAQLASVGFDVAYCEVFGALPFGATLCIPPTLFRQEPAQLARWIRDERITVLQVTPSLFREIERQWKDDELSLLAEQLSSIFFVGEKLTPVHLSRVWPVFRGRVAIFNVYGPSEVVAATYHLIDDSSLQFNSVPIGQPIPGREIFLVGTQGEAVGRAQVGEIWIRSDFLTTGYWRGAEKERERFIDSAGHKLPAGRYYRSGDLARSLPDGRLEFMGRLDLQLKVRGVRIEVEEVEGALLCQPEILRAAIVGLERTSEDMLLVGHYEAAEPLQVDDLRARLGQLLPRAMIPTRFFWHAALPLLSNGKIDRVRLQEGGHSLDEMVDDDKPQTAVEVELAALWKQLLGCSRVRRSDDFFQLGGHSLLAASMLTRVRESFSADVDLRSFWKNATLLGLAGAIARVQSAPASVNTLAEEISAMSDEEIEEQLRQPRHFV